MLFISSLCLPRESDWSCRTSSFSWSFNSFCISVYSSSSRSLNRIRIQHCARETFKVKSVLNQTIAHISNPMTVNVIDTVCLTKNNSFGIHSNISFKAQLLLDHLKTCRNMPVWNCLFCFWIGLQKGSNRYFHTERQIQKLSTSTISVRIQNLRGSCCSFFYFNGELSKNNLLKNWRTWSSWLLGFPFSFV